MSLGERIRELRKRNSLTQEELARKIISSQKNISKYERDESFPNPDTLRLLALALDTTADYLIGVPNAPISSKSQKTPEFSLLMEETADFSKDEAIKLLEYARLLKKGR